MIRTIAFGIFATLITVLWFPFMLLRPRHPGNALFPAMCIRAFCEYCLNIRFRIEGLHNLIKSNKNGKIIVINHQSVFDLLILAEIWPYLNNNATVISKRELLWQAPFFGIAAYMWGTLFINRSNPGEAIKAINEQTDAICNQNKSLIFFPEGTRGNMSTILPFKRGAFVLANEYAHCSILPIVASKCFWKINYSAKLTILHPIRCVAENTSTNNLINDIHSKMNRTFLI